MEFENLLKLVECVSRSDVSSFCYEQGGTKIKMKKSRAGSQPESVPGGGEGNQAGSVPGGGEGNQAESMPGGREGNQPESMPGSMPGGEGSQTEIKCPLVGIFYQAPGEDAPPFVSVGDLVKKGQTLGIVEAMKLMNEIESECDGVVVEIPVQNGQAVEYGQTLFVIAPARG